jgi:poly-gamma-glutamate synthesis protein (capsule biosynthesis protein)
MKLLFFGILLIALNVALLFVYFVYLEDTTREHERDVLSIRTLEKKHESTSVREHGYDAVMFTGDIMLGRNVEKLSAEFGSAYPYLQLPPSATHTALVGNFESSIPQKHVPAPNGTFAFSVHTKYLPSLKTYGFDYVSLANNHSYDYGVEGFTHAKQSLTSAGMRPFGDQKNQASSTIEYVTLDNTIIALIGLYAVYGRPTDTDLKVLVDRALLQSELQFVYVHWGDEYELIHNLFQQNLARDMIDLGVDAVIGHHPHVVQDIELYKGAPIFYSLGNFIFDQYFSQDVQTGLMVTFSEGKTENKFSLAGITSIGTKSQPRMMSEKEQSVFS